MMDLPHGLTRLTRALGWSRIPGFVFTWQGREHYPVLNLGIVRKDT